MLMEDKKSIVEPKRRKSKSKWKSVELYLRLIWVGVMMELVLLGILIKMVLEIGEWYRG